MNEYRRMQYLDAMGIEMFIPRKQLPGGKPSVALTVVRPAAIHSTQPVSLPLDNNSSGTRSPTTEASVKIATVTTANEFISVNPLLDEVLQQKAPSPRADRSSITTIQPTPAGQSNNIHFCLNIWSLAEWLIIDTHQPHSALPTETLLHNILWSLGVKESLPKTDTIHWPMVANTAAPAGLDAAREMMTAFVDTKLKNYPVKTVLLFGQAAFDTCTTGDSFGKVIFTTRKIGNTIALIVPSLAQLLTTPHLKAATWRALNSLSSSNE